MRQMTAADLVNAVVAVAGGHQHSAIVTSREVKNWCRAADIDTGEDDPGRAGRHMEGAEDDETQSGRLRIAKWRRGRAANSMLGYSLSDAKAFALAKREAEANGWFIWCPRCSDYREAAEGISATTCARCAP